MPNSRPVSAAGEMAWERWLWESEESGLTNESLPADNLRGQVSSGYRRSPLPPSKVAAVSRSPMSEVMRIFPSEQRRFDALAVF